MGIHFKCPVCLKTAEVTKEIRAGGKIFKKLTCKHTAIVKESDASEGASIYEAIVSSDGRHIMPFQIESIQFMEKAGFRGLFADEPGLGKTVEVMGLLKLHMEEMCPALIVCKAKLRTQINAECIRWTGVPAQVIEANYQKAHFYKKAIVIVSYDMLWRMKWDDSVWSKFKTVILDECQHMKNPESKRTKKLRELASGETLKNIIGSSGTPAKNNPLELFTFFNMCRPDLFKTETGFVLKYLDVYETGKGVRKVGGVRPDAMEAWDEVTSKFMIRHKRVDVLPDLPTVDRQFRMCDLAEEVEEAYNAEMEGYIKEYDDGTEMSFKKYSNLLAYITRMRHLVGLSKIDDTIEEVDEILLGTDEKVVVFSHHIDVAEILMRKLMKRMDEGGFNAEPLWFQGGMSDAAAENVIKAFVEGPHRVLVASALASGEGVDRLQKVCKRCIMHERQWNPANEEQCEGRFTRIDSLAKDGEKVLAKYMVAIGTIDEWFTELVDGKRANLASAMDKDVTAVRQLNEQSLTREMMDIIASKGRKRWRLQ